MKKEAIIYIIIGILILISLLSFAYFLSIQPRLAPFSFTPSIPQNCSNEIEVKLLWESFFVENSNNISIFPTLSASDDPCISYFAIKTSNEIFHIIWGRHVNDTNGTSKLIFAYRGSGTQEYLNELKNITDIQNISDNIIPNYLNNSNNITSKLLLRNTTNIPDAEGIFTTQAFNIIPSNWVIIQTENNISTAYAFTGAEQVGNDSIIINGTVDANYSLETLFYFELANSSINYTTPTCNSNWTAINTSCQSGDTYTTWYNDTNLCLTLTSQPANITTDCDFNNNRVIGDQDSVNDNNLEIEIYINSSLLNTSRQYAGTQKVEIKENNNTKVELNYNFSSQPLNLRNITIEKQSSGSRFGYLIVSGLPYSKIMTIDKLNSSSSEVCIRNREVSSVSEFSSDCDSSSETLLDCPDSSGQFTCSATSNTFIVSGLTNSGVKEFIPPPPSSGSSSSSSSSGSQTPPPTNTTNQTSGTTSPATTQTCTPNWQCTEWQPETCPKDEKQTKVCTDTNNCGTNAGKPSEETTCEYKSKLSAWLIVIIIISILIITTASVIVFLLIKRNKKVETLPSTKYTFPYYKTHANQRLKF